MKKPNGHFAQLALISLCLIAPCAAGSFSVGELPKDFALWTGRELRGYEGRLRSEVSGPNKTSSVKLADYGSSNVAISHREADGIAELHDNFDDYFTIQSGEAVLRIGGTVVNPKRQEDKTELRGDSVQGGKEVALHPGDVIHIPSGVPHQMMVKKGTRITYFVIKVKSH